MVICEMKSYTNLGQSKKLADAHLHRINVEEDDALPKEGEMVLAYKPEETWYHPLDAVAHPATCFRFGNKCVGKTDQLCNQYTRT